MIYVMLFFGIFFIFFGDGWCGCDFFSFFGMLLGCVASRELMDDVCWRAYDMSKDEQDVGTYTQRLKGRQDGRCERRRETGLGHERKK